MTDFPGQSKSKNRTRTKTSLKYQNLKLPKIGIEPKCHDPVTFSGWEKNMTAFKWSILYIAVSV